MPTAETDLKAILSYWNATVKVNLEGDVLISDDTIHGLGILQRFLHSFFGTLFLIAKPTTRPFPSSEPIESFQMAIDPSSSADRSADVDTPGSPRPDEQATETPVDEAEAEERLGQSVKSLLMSCVPNPGYFVAGGLAGIVSRTSTAPLDRLKVYLIAQTEVTKEVVAEAQSGNVFRAIGRSWKPLAVATKELWEAGGMRSLYAGEWYHTNASEDIDMYREWPERGQSHARVSNQVWVLRGKYKHKCDDASNNQRLPNERSPSWKVTAILIAFIHGPNLLPVASEVCFTLVYLYSN